MFRLITGVVMGVSIGSLSLCASHASSIPIPHKHPLPYQAIIIEKDHCSIPSLFGTFPRQIGVSMQALADISHNPENFWIPRRINDNRMILYGPPGNGKTLLAQRFADLTNSSFKYINAAEVLKTFQNSGAQAIKEIFDEIERFLEETQGTLVLFFDEIDALGATRNDQNNSHIDTERAMQALWTKLSYYEREPRLFFIFATNTIERIPGALLNRCDSDKVIEIGNPVLQERKEKIRNFLMYNDSPALNRLEVQRFISRLLKLQATHAIPADQLTDYYTCMREVQQSLYALADHMGLGSKQDTAYIQKAMQHSEALLAQLVKRGITIIQQESPDKALLFQQLEKGYCNIIRGYLASVKAFLAKPIVEPKKEIVDYTAEKTEGLSTRTLIAIAKKLSDYIQNGTDVTVTIMDGICTEAHKKAKLEEAESKKKQREEQLKDLQIEELQEKKKHYALDLQLKELQLEEAKNKKDMRGIENKTAYFRLIQEIRVAHNGKNLGNQNNSLSDIHWKAQANTKGGPSQAKSQATLKALKELTDKANTI